MRPHFRLALPTLDRLGTETCIAFIQVDKEGRVARAGESAPAELAALAGSSPVYALLHPNDAVVVSVTVPPVPPRNLDAAVAASIEPMILSNIEQLCIGHGPRAPDGTVIAAWTARKPLLGAWALLAQAGLNVKAFLPQSLAIQADDARPEEPLTLPAGPRWLGLLPNWSMAPENLRPASAGGRWRKAAWWGAAAAAVWVVGLNLYASNLESEVDVIRHDMQKVVKTAFPHIPTIIDPLRQAQKQRDALRLAQGVVPADDFMPLALATAQVLAFARGHVRALHYQKGVLTLELVEGYLPPDDETALVQSAAVQQLVLTKDPSRPGVWHARRVAASSGAGS
ncbi:MAG TPA: type II secretion system protein GspL [Pusillimonas sp.]|uniref:type II secretion system protein GspL n=1 Tax=Pusillimonas sp. TaxID=3040095 RepID=UPI002C5D301C|nr:type II secretion system protein GspL [Pusillimonas sp.]HUH87847.1 type II secretion system protein GspL [Pusillimonas sp.]